MTANMTITASQMKKIVADLARRDARFAKVIDAHPLCTIGRNPKPVSHFEALVESVISQQLAVKAADTIYGRVKGLAQGRVVPVRIAAISEQDLRAAGVSGAKFKTIQGLADTALTKKIKITQHVYYDMSHIVGHLFVGECTSSLEYQSIFSVLTGHGQQTKQCDNL